MFVCEWLSLPPRRGARALAPCGNRERTRRLTPGTGRVAEADGEERGPAADRRCERDADRLPSTPRDQAASGEWSSLTQQAYRRLDGVRRLELNEEGASRRGKSPDPGGAQPRSGRAGERYTGGPMAGVRGRRRRVGGGYCVGSRRGRRRDTRGGGQHRLYPLPATVDGRTPTTVDEQRVVVAAAQQGELLHHAPAARVGTTCVRGSRAGEDLVRRVGHTGSAGSAVAAVAAAVGVEPPHRFPRPGVGTGSADGSCRAHQAGGDEPPPREPPRGWCSVGGAAVGLRRL